MIFLLEVVITVLVHGRAPISTWGGEIAWWFPSGKKTCPLPCNIEEEKAQAEEVGGKGYLIFHYFFLTLGLKWSPPHKITLKCMKSQILFLFPPRNLSGTLTVSQGERVVEAHGKRGIVPDHRVSNCKLPEFSPKLTPAVFAYWCCVGHGQRSEQSRSIMSLTPAIRCGYKWISEFTVTIKTWTLMCTGKERHRNLWLE